MEGSLFRHGPPGAETRTRAEELETAPLIDLYHECGFPLEMLDEQATDRMRDTQNRMPTVRVSGR